MWEGAAFAPGHASGIFQIFDSAPDPARCGSRGCGACFELGARTHVMVEKADSQVVEVLIDGAASDAPVTRRAVELLIGVTPLRVRVATSLDLPVSQGFGMSAAGALSTTLAVASALGLARSDAVLAAHEAEVTLKTGLGDVVAATQGGVEMRKTAGLPPYGSINTIPFDGDFVLAVIGARLETRDVLSNARMREAVNAAGGKALQALFDSPTIENMFRLSRAFARDSGLVTPLLREALSAVDEAEGLGTMSMLGNSVFAVGDTRLLEKALKPFGETFVAPVEKIGARAIRDIRH